MAATRWKARQRGRIHFARESETGSTKSLLVSTDTPRIEAGIIQYVFVKYTASATTGTRTLKYEIQEPDGTIKFEWIPGTASTVILSETKTISAVQTGGTLGYNGQEATNVHLVEFPAGVLVQDGDIIKVHDSAAVDATGDTLDVTVAIEEV